MMSPPPPPTHPPHPTPPHPHPPTHPPQPTPPPPTHPNPHTQALYESLREQVFIAERALLYVLNFNFLGVNAHKVRGVGRQGGGPEGRCPSAVGALCCGATRRCQLRLSCLRLDH